MSSASEKEKLLKEISEIEALIKDAKSTKKSTSSVQPALAAGHRDPANELWKHGQAWGPRFPFNTSGKPFAGWEKDLWTPGDVRPRFGGRGHYGGGRFIRGPPWAPRGGWQRHWGPGMMQGPPTSFARMSTVAGKDSFHIFPWMKQEDDTTSASNISAIEHAKKLLYKNKVNKESKVQGSQSAQYESSAVKIEVTDGKPVPSTAAAQHQVDQKLVSANSQKKKMESKMELLKQNSLVLSEQNAKIEKLKTMLISYEKAVGSKKVSEKPETGPVKSAQSKVEKSAANSESVSRKMKRLTRSKPSKPSTKLTLKTSTISKELSDSSSNVFEISSSPEVSELSIVPDFPSQKIKSESLEFPPAVSPQVVIPVEKSKSHPHQTAVVTHGHPLRQCHEKSAGEKSVKPLGTKRAKSKLVDSDVTQGPSKKQIVPCQGGSYLSPLRVRVSIIKEDLAPGDAADNSSTPGEDVIMLDPVQRHSQRSETKPVSLCDTVELENVSVCSEEELATSHSKSMMCDDQNSRRHHPLLKSASDVIATISEMTPSVKLTTSPIAKPLSHRWSNVGPTSGRQDRRWSNVGPTTHCYLGCETVDLTMEATDIPSGLDCADHVIDRGSGIDYVDHRVIDIRPSSNSVDYEMKSGKAKQMDELALRDSNDRYEETKPYPLQAEEVVQIESTEPKKDNPETSGYKIDTMGGPELPFESSHDNEGRAVKDPDIKRDLTDLCNAAEANTLPKASGYKDKNRYYPTQEAHGGSGVATAGAPCDNFDPLDVIELSDEEEVGPARSVCTKGATDSPDSSYDDGSDKIACPQSEGPLSLDSITSERKIGCGVDVQGHSRSHGLELVDEVMAYQCKIEPVTDYKAYQFRNAGNLSRSCRRSIYEDDPLCSDQLGTEELAFSAAPMISACHLVASPSDGALYEEGFSPSQGEVVPILDEDFTPPGSPIPHNQGTTSCRPASPPTSVSQQCLRRLSAMCRAPSSAMRGAPSSTMRGAADAEARLGRARAMPRICGKLSVSRRGTDVSEAVTSGLDPPQLSSRGSVSGAGNMDRLLLAGRLQGTAGRHNMIQARLLTKVAQTRSLLSPEMKSPPVEQNQAGPRLNSREGLFGHKISSRSPFKSQTPLLDQPSPMNIYPDCSNEVEHLITRDSSTSDALKHSTIDIDGREDTKSPVNLPATKLPCKPVSSEVCDIPADSQPLMLSDHSSQERDDDPSDKPDSCDLSKHGLTKVVTHYRVLNDSTGSKNIRIVTKKIMRATGHQPQAVVRTVLFGVDATAIASLPESTKKIVDVHLDLLGADDGEITYSNVNRDTTVSPASSCTDKSDVAQSVSACLDKHRISPPAPLKGDKPETDQAPLIQPNISKSTTKSQCTQTVDKWPDGRSKPPEHSENMLMSAAKVELPSVMSLGRRPLRMAASHESHLQKGATALTYIPGTTSLQTGFKGQASRPVADSSTIQPKFHAKTSSSLVKQLPIPIIKQSVSPAPGSSSADESVKPGATFRSASSATIGSPQNKGGSQSDCKSHDKPCMDVQDGDRSSSGGGSHDDFKAALAKHLEFGNAIQRMLQSRSQKRMSQDTTASESKSKPSVEEVADVSGHSDQYHRDIAENVIKSCEQLADNLVDFVNETSKGVHKNTGSTSGTSKRSVSDKRTKSVAGHELPVKHPLVVKSEESHKQSHADDNSHPRTISRQTSNVSSLTECSDTEHSGAENTSKPAIIGRHKLVRSLSGSSNGSGKAASNQKLRQQFIKRALLMTQRCLHRKLITQIRQSSPHHAGGRGQGRRGGHWARRGYRGGWHNAGPYEHGADLDACEHNWRHCHHSRGGWRWHKYHALHDIYDGKGLESHAPPHHRRQHGRFHRSDIHPQNDGEDPFHHWKKNHFYKHPHSEFYRGRHGGAAANRFPVPEMMPLNRSQQRRRRSNQSRRSRLKVDNRPKAGPSQRSQPKESSGKRPLFGRSHKLVMIGGIAYRTNKTQLERINKSGKRVPRRRSSSTKSPRPSRRSLLVDGVKYRLSRSGRRLRRVSSGEPKKGKLSHVNLQGVTYLKSRPGSLVRAAPTSTQKRANRSLMKSIATVVNAVSRKKMDPSRQFCIFYNRFGKCKRGDKCPYIHDPEKIAVCTRFLRGTCQVTNCPFSHKVAPNKMPVCVHFLRGSCSRDKCPYLHVNVGKNAKVCPDFLKGYCPQGERCKKMHTLVCPEYRSTGKCSRGQSCPLKHPVKRAPGVKTTATSRNVGTVPISPGAPSKYLRLDHMEIDNDDDDVDLPWHQRHLPSYIALSKQESVDGMTPSTPSAENLQIRPNLLHSPDI